MFFPGAPAISVEPETATAVPSSNPPDPSEAVSLASWDHAPPTFANTYAAPWAPTAKGAPTAMVEPEIDTEAPNSSSAVPSEAVSSACWDHVVPDRTNT